jgi:Lysosomal transcription factor, NCU-G1
MQIDLIAKNVSFLDYSSPRVAFEFLTVSSENKNEGAFRLKRRRNLDDEFTPGIFDVYDIVSPRSHNASKGAFYQYRPVCYTTKWRTVSDSTEMHQGKFYDFNIRDDEIKKFEDTLPFSFYGYSLDTKIVQGSNITFGAPNDGFYIRSNYSSFSMLMGMGSPPVEKLSYFVVTFAIIGLGVPLLVLLVGGSYVAVKRYRN